MISGALRGLQLTLAEKVTDMSKVNATTKAETEREHQMRMCFVSKLRVNVKSLAAEARAIRHEEHKASSSANYLRKIDPLSEAAVWADSRLISLQCHRRGVVREQARLAQLALAFVRGVPYRTVEQKTHDPVQGGDILNKLKKMGTLYQLGCIADGDCFKKIRAWLSVGE